MSLPPKDSWITLGPGAKVTIDGPLQAKWQDLSRVGREIRGNVLAHSFAVEFALDNVLTRTLFDDHKNSDPNARARPGAFDELVLKRRLNFAAKIKLLRELRARFAVLEKAFPDTAFPTLEHVRDIRNRFAHYPITFKPGVSPDGETDLSMWLVCRDQEIELTPEYLEKAGASFAEVQRALEAANSALHENESGV